MLSNYLVFILFAILVIFSVFLILLSSNAVQSVFGLVLSYIGVSFMLIWLGLDYFAALFVVVYVGSVAILILFVVMLLQTKSVYIDNTTTASFILSLWFLVFLAYILDQSKISITDGQLWDLSLNSSLHISPNGLLTNFFLINTANITLVAQFLFLYTWFQFILAGLILLLGLLGVVILVL